MIEKILNSNHLKMPKLRKFGDLFNELKLFCEKRYEIRMTAYSGMLCYRMHDGNFCCISLNDNGECSLDNNRRKYFFKNVVRDYEEILKTIKASV